MTDTNEPGAQQNNSQEPGAPGGNNSQEPGAQSGNNGQTSFDQLDAATQEYIRQLRSENAEHRKKLKDNEASTKAQQEKQWEEQQKFKLLADSRGAEIDTLKPFKERFEALETMLTQSNETRVSKIPETHKSLIPDGYAPDQLSAWLDKNMDKLTRTPAPDTDAGAGGQGSSNTLPELASDEKAMAAAMQMSAKEYAKYKDNESQPFEFVEKDADSG